jgi:hypothetical protein
MKTLLDLCVDYGIPVHQDGDHWSGPSAQKRLTYPWLPLLGAIFRAAGNFLRAANRRRIHDRKTKETSFTHDPALCDPKFTYDPRRWKDVPLVN